MNEHPEDAKRQLDRLYAEERRAHACRARDAAEFERWRAPAREAFLRLLAIDRIARESQGHEPQAELATGGEDMGAYVRRRGSIETEPGVRARFWLLRPKGDGPFPLAVTPHGHENGDAYVGLWTNEVERRRIADEDRDVAVQAARRGFLTLAPATRGIGQNPNSFTIADVAHRHGGAHCQCHNWQVALAGRTLLGERVWDLSRLLDWALALPEVDPAGTVLMLGNSGGGMATLHTAAADERVTVAVPCCAYNNYVSPRGTMRHCPCNAVSGLMDFGEVWDVAGLVAPRRLLTVNGRADDLHPTDEVDHAVSRLKTIYAAAGHPEAYEHRYGDGGHRFYSDAMWPWIDKAVGARR